MRRSTCSLYRAGSRIFPRGGRGPILGGFGLQRGHFSVKMYTKTKELGPVGGACAGYAPPRSAYALHQLLEVLHCKKDPVKFCKNVNAMEFQRLNSTLPQQGTIKFFVFKCDSRNLCLVEIEF